jgi:hypothetical protein
VAKGKGIVAEGNGGAKFPGQSRNTCPTVAYAECYHHSAPCVDRCIFDGRCKASVTFFVEGESPMKREPIFRGVATALITPLTDAGVDYPALEKLINWQIEKGITSCNVFFITHKSGYKICK